MDTEDTRRATAGPVTFLPEGGPARDRTVIRLLTVITVLLGILVLGLSAGAIWLALEYQRAQAAFSGQAQAWRNETTQAIALTQGLTRDLLVRQDALGADLQALAAQTRAQMGELDRRRAAFGAIPADPFGKADYAIRMSQLGLDEARLINRHVAAAQNVLGRNFDLTPAQRQLLRDLEAAKPATKPSP